MSSSPSALEPHPHLNMNCESSLDIGVIDFSLPQAYRHLNITDTSISDAAVVASFHKQYTVQRHVDLHWCTKALALISRHRESSLLAFILTIVPHLTEENVSILAAQPSPPKNVSVERIGQGDEQPDKKSEPIVALSPLTAVPSPLPTASAATTVDVVSSSTSGESTPNNAGSSDSMYSSPDDNASFASGKTASTGFDVSSGGDASTESDFSEPVGGKYWDGEDWRCEECNEGLLEGKCPHGDAINPCRVCGRDLQSGSCSMFCDECHDGLEGPCSECARGGHQQDEESAAGKMAWDENDGVWRCTTCLWEVEANSKKEGQCHCQVDPDVRLSPDSSCIFSPWSLIN